MRAVSVSTKIWEGHSFSRLTVSPRLSWQASVGATPPFTVPCRRVRPQVYQVLSMDRTLSQVLRLWLLLRLLWLRQVSRLSSSLSWWLVSWVLWSGTSRDEYSDPTWASASSPIAASNSFTLYRQLLTIRMLLLANKLRALWRTISGWSAWYSSS